MEGKANQYDPAEMFRDWIQKSGKAQQEFLKTFTSLMTPEQEKPQAFDPLTTLKGMVSNTGKAQNMFMENVSSMQNKALSNMLAFGQGMSNFLAYSAFKTTIGTNGRISIPEAERDALGIKDGDLVQVFIFPIAKKQKSNK